MQTRRFRFVEVNLNNTAAQQFYFDTDATLQDAVHITAIETYSVSDVTKSPQTGKALVADAILAKSYLTIVSKSNDEEVISNIPLVNLNRKANNGNLTEFNIPTPNVTKCYIRVADTTSLVAGTIWLLGFHYVNKHDLAKQSVPVKH